MEKQPEEQGQHQVGLAVPTKVLNVLIPETVYWHIRFCASESRMSVKQFMAEFCRTATPMYPTIAQSPESAVGSQQVTANQQSRSTPSNSDHRKETPR